jgi:acetolactate synthase-1/2/3 large subunit
MQNEINTAVRYGVKAVWIVLNDSQYGMIEQGMRGLKMSPVETEIPTVDFVALARSLGADGVAVKRESELNAALQRALRAEGPFVVDVTIDRRELAPMGRRVSNLIAQGVEGR